MDNTVVLDDNVLPIDVLLQIHNDLGVIVCFISLFIVFALFYFIYRAISNLFTF